MPGAANPPAAPSCAQDEATAEFLLESLNTASPLFRQQTEKRKAKIVQAMFKKSVDQGETIYNQGEEGDDFW